MKCSTITLAFACTIIKCSSASGNTSPQRKRMNNKHISTDTNRRLESLYTNIAVEEPYDPFLGLGDKAEEEKEFGRILQDEAAIPTYTPTAADKIPTYAPTAADKIPTYAPTTGASEYGSSEEPVVTEAPVSDAPVVAEVVITTVAPGEEENVVTTIVPKVEEEIIEETTVAPVYEEMSMPSEDKNVDVIAGAESEIVNSSSASLAALVVKTASIAAGFWMMV